MAETAGERILEIRKKTLHPKAHICVERYRGWDRDTDERPRWRTEWHAQIQVIELSEQGTNTKGKKSEDSNNCGSKYEHSEHCFDHL